jgi:hypothetical protein
MGCVRTGTRGTVTAAEAAQRFQVMSLAYTGTIAHLQRERFKGSVSRERFKGHLAFMLFLNNSMYYV